jgi:hypothetical protein
MTLLFDHNHIFCMLTSFIRCAVTLIIDLVDTSFVVCCPLGVHHVISSIPGSLSNMFARDPQAIKSIVALTREQNLRFTILLSSFTDKVTNVYQRQVLVVVLRENVQDEKNTSRDIRSETLFDELTKGMENEKQALNLEVISLPKEADATAHTDIAIVKCYNQHNLGSSRKQVAPLMTNILSKL